ncbi:GNAT family N-acetyltransferase [Pararhizobium mangrovi]|uniref:GNAT family N-acetyltransferase n=1 Tax=Pararhizobium mangrovi TaxID=2590452 RepID=A0A506TXY5_9HYPH|nr:GNAT family N-acetyltransferase [Pararhizobium mangrovi]TPW26058.1 GNAT family N-acetyltransferase [Pararhizobium mangrovi]
MTTVSGDIGVEAAARPDLAAVRRLEAVGFRAWPAASVQYDGSWQLRLTAGHPSKRLNSVNPLDPSDTNDLETRIERAAGRFRAYGRPLVFRQTPLAPDPLDAYFDTHGWSRFDETQVMTADIAAIDLSAAQDRVPVRDLGRYVDASIAILGHDLALKPGLTEVLSSIRPPSGLFVLADDAGPAASLLCVQDNDLAGLFEIGTRADARRRGLARSTIATALAWARQNGAHRAWLQVERANAPALSLYGALGFEETYRYVYRQRSEP